MGHKADKSFFDQKRSWSRRKDRILGYYLEPYLAKVRRLRRPVLLVDGYAGPGKYRDGEDGSPLIMCAKALAANARPGPKVCVFCIEKDPDLFEQLKHNLGTFDFADARCGEFSEYVNKIRERARSYTVFLYIDPWRVSHISLDSLEKVASQIRAANSSVELLLNFNTPIFVRSALAALKQEVPAADPQNEDIEDQEPMPEEPQNHDKLSQIVGGEWWREIVSSNRPFPLIVQDVINRVEQSLRKQFSEVCWLGIKKQRDHSVPAYHMVFGSRHPHALLLMNDAMIVAREYSEFEMNLFAEDEVDKMIIDSASGWIRRDALVLNIIRRIFCNYYEKDIRRRIGALLKERKLESETGKLRINDSVRVRRRN